MLTERVQLIDGITWEDRPQREVTLRAPIVADTIEAERKTGDRGMVYLALAMLAEQIVSFGEIPQDKMSADLLTRLTDVDFERMNEARDVLKKKAVWSPRV